MAVSEVLSVALPIAISACVGAIGWAFRSLHQLRLDVAVLQSQQADHLRALQRLDGKIDDLNYDLNHPPILNGHNQ